MPLPSLLHKGTVKPGKNIDSDDKKNLKNIRAIDYILRFIERRMETKRASAKIRPKKMGHKVLLIRSGTGSGKSTTIAPEIYKKFHPIDRRNIIITQPKVLTAIDKAQDMASIFKELTLGQNVGYQTGPRKHIPRERGITSMTPGILLNILVSSTPEEITRKYSFILIDEIHEKDINTETNLFLLKKFLKEYWAEPLCPFIIMMSATFDPKQFMDYFECPPSNFIEVEGRTFPIRAHFPKYDIHNYLKYALWKTLELHVNNIEELGTGKVQDIMIFVKNKKDAKTIIQGLHMFNSAYMTKGLSASQKYVMSMDRGIKGGRKNDKYYILPILLNRQSFREGGSDYRNLFANIEYLKTPIYNIEGENLGGVKKFEPASRKVIVSTPIAETGITIETLKYCIDTGWVLSPEFNPDFGTEILLNKNVTKNMAEQRQGRVGRLDKGEWYPCYTEETFNSLSEDLYSKFITEDITSFLLNIIVNETKTTIEEVNPDDYTSEEQKLLFRMYKLRPSWNKLLHEKAIDFKSLDFFDSPSSSGLCYSLEKLYILGLIDMNYNPTILGYLINRIRKIDIEVVRMIFAGFSHEANILDLITIASFLQVGRRNICGRNYKSRNPADLDDNASEFYNRVIIADEFIDCLFIWNEFMYEVGRIENMVKEGSKTKFSINYIQKWCDDNRVHYDGLIDVIHARDEMIESFISIGVNPYWNGLGLKIGTYNLNKIIKDNLEEGIEEIKKIKRCILDGFRLNLATWNKYTNNYEMMHRPAKISVRSSLVNKINAEQERPQIIALSGLLVAADFDNVTYSYQATGCVSVLDGFVDVDVLFAKK